MMRLLSIGVTPGLLVLGVLLFSASARQLNFATTVGSEAFASYDDGLLTPLGDLSLLSLSEYTTLTHPVFPRYSVRVKRSDFCDGAVQAYTGYIDVQARHLFFYFFESRRDPDKDDVIFWTNGGPGASSSMGLFMELGPCRVTDANATESHPYSWNEHANVFFVDQPVGVGFSYAEYGETVSTTFEAADDIAAFMTIFFEHFTKFKGRALHLAGESYGGRYIPVFAATIYDKNAQLLEAGLTPINLTSVMIGNGCTDFATMYPSYYDAQCQDPTFPAVQGIADCVRMKQLVPRCTKRYQESCVEKTDGIDCAAAVAFCNTAMSELFADLNHYDRARPCKGAADITECYPIVKNIDDYLSNPDTQERLGVDLAARGNFSHGTPSVNLAFRQHLDHWGFPAQYYISALLERGVRALIYVGATDYICNWIGNERMTLALEWTKQEEFRSQPLTEWTVDGQVAGVTRSGGGLTYATISGAGHMAPYDKPVESLELANRWLAGETL
ncbi:serine carboxypeptidase [Lentinus brumalis]|uniref:Carboxypeptidase n=1 Tax=Lentinus brumalis TaxID=2498619 RepID=A0A371DA26_9APHY|nr:serine carboxypeptidase [Polyporus brumalis]